MELILHVSYGIDFRRHQLYRFVLFLQGFGVDVHEADQGMQSPRQASRQYGRQGARVPCAIPLLNNTGEPR